MNQNIEEYYGDMSSFPSLPFFESGTCDFLYLPSLGVMRN